MKVSDISTPSEFYCQLLAEDVEKYKTNPRENKAITEPDWCSVALGRLIWKQTNHSECNRTAYPGRLCLMHLAETRAMSCNVRAAYLWKVRDNRNNWLDKNVATVPMICLVTVYLLEKSAPNTCRTFRQIIPIDYTWYPTRKRDKIASSWSASRNQWLCGRGINRWLCCTNIDGVKRSQHAA